MQPNYCKNRSFTSLQTQFKDKTYRRYAQKSQKKHQKIRTQFNLALQLLIETKLGAYPAHAPQEDACISKKRPQKTFKISVHSYSFVHPPHEISKYFLRQQFLSIQILSPNTPESFFLANTMFCSTKSTQKQRAHRKKPTSPLFKILATHSE